MEFSFLESLGFRGEARADDCVVFTSDKVSVLVTWNVRSGELDVGIGLLLSKEPLYSLRDVLAMECCCVPEAKCPFQVIDEGRLGHFLHILSGHLKKYGVRALEGDRIYFRRLDEFRSKGARELMEEMRIRQVRKKAEQAWKEGRYREAADQYLSIVESLKISERKRISIGHGKDAQGKPLVDK